MSQSFHRGRRLRWTPEIRSMVRETPPLLAEDLIMPYFVVETEDQSFRKEIGAMPGQYQLSLTELEKQVEKAVDDGLKSVILFGIPSVKDEKASGAYAEDGIVQEAVRRLKHRWPSLYVITDVCLCEYMSHGHCGILTPGGAVLNDPTLELLAKTAVSHGGPLRHDGRPRGRHPSRPGRIRPGHGAHHVLCREIRLCLLRSLP